MNDRGLQAYLVIREGTKWTDVFRLVPGRTVTIGRANTNQIVVKDERCSRFHAEIFQTQGEWILRDLDSRNGTQVGGEKVSGDYRLTPGDIVRIAHCQMAFVHDVALAFADSSTICRLPPEGSGEAAGKKNGTDKNALRDPGVAGDVDAPSDAESPDGDSASIHDAIDSSGPATGSGTSLPLPASVNAIPGDVADEGPQQEPALITHRRQQTRFLERGREDDGGAMVGKAAARLCRLAFTLAKQPDQRAVAKSALDGLLESTNVDAGAVLLLAQDAAAQADETDSVSATIQDPPPVGARPDPARLRIVASRSDRKPTYHRVSRFLAETVLREGEAVLARNVEDDTTFGSRDSKGEIHSTGVICAPIRQDGQVIGLIHLYSTVSERIPDPVDLEFTLAVAENVALALKNLAKQQQLAENLTVTLGEVQQLRKRLGAESEIVGSSPAVLQLQQEIERAAPSRATVLIRGESGVGKELVARAIHFASPRKKGPFVCLNCAALSETLLESELFGHEKGAFTGATERKLGKFEAAHEGTLMLDEIGEMSPAIQAKFLRVLEGHPFERVGGNQAIKVDVRVIAATNRDLEKAVNDGAFRRDLFFRLRVVELNVPALRKRGDDVLELALHFLARFNQETGRKIRGFTTEAVDHMKRYRWPGNIRELKNVVERAVVLSRGDVIGIEDLMLTSLATASESGEVTPPRLGYEPLSLDEVERRHIRQTLNATGWNKSRSAIILGIERSTLDRKIARYGIGQKE
jgi:Nif-specific regulatory protein